MKAKRKYNVFYVLAMFLLISACIGTNSNSGIKPTFVPPPSDTPTIETTATSEQTASPTVTVVAGSFADFHLFAAEIATALQDRNISFFEEYATPSVWSCLGDETAGVCKDLPSDAAAEGIPLAYDWARYELPGAEDYRAMWQTTFASHSVVKLAAIANQLGDNPLMPMAGQSFQAIVGVADNNDPSSIHEVRVLFFEYYDTWHLAGELVTIERAEAWLNDTCDRCYDTWAAWPE